jgi:hypothetical protein
MINKLFTLIILLLFSTCNNNENSSNTKTPRLKNKIKSDKGLKQGKEGKEKPRKVDQSKDDKLTCHNICLQLGWCNQKLFEKKEGENKRFKICRKLCKHDKSETGKAKKSAFKECVNEYRGDQCQELKKCLKEKFLARKKKLHGKGPNPDKPKK